jgi:two-component system, chemotaxis family, CheB/CheR fusion protein
MSNDDLQSLNRELTALNHRLQATVERERATFRNLQNILDSTEVPILVLDTDLNIRFFTPAGKALFSIVASDVGRPLADLSRRFEDDDLLADAWAVLESHTPVRREVRTDEGSWFIRATLPYRRSNGSGIEGVVITFIDICDINNR